MKRKLHFGRVCAAIALMSSAVADVNGQTVLRADGTMYLVPPVLTVDGKARISVRNNQTAHVYSKNMIEERTFTMNRPTYTESSHSEVANVQVTGATISYFGDGSEWSWGHWDEEESQYVYTTIEASNLEEARTKLASLLGGNYTIQDYDIDGHQFLWYESKNYGSSSNYYLYEIFGNKYPENGLYIKDGKLFRSSYIDYNPLYDESTAVWTPQNDEKIEEFTENICSYSYINADGEASMYDGSELYFTQSFFNNDEKWEYVVTEHSGMVETYYLNSIGTKVQDDGTIRLTRSVTRRVPVSGLKICSQDGSVIARIDVDYNNTNEDWISNMSIRKLWTINGKCYVEIRKTGYYWTSMYKYELYLIDKGTSNVRKVLEYESEGEMTEDNTIYDLSGRKLTEKPATGVYIQGGKKYLAQ